MNFLLMCKVVGHCSKITGQVPAAGITRRLQTASRIGSTVSHINQRRKDDEVFSVRRRTLVSTSGDPEAGRQQATDSEADFRIIYKFPYIQHARVVCRLKLFQTGVTLSAVPTSGILAALEVIDVQSFLTTVYVAVFASGMVYVMGSFFRSLVGIMYLNGTQDVLKVAHLTFWGGRREIELPVIDVVPFGDRNESPKNIYFSLRRYSVPSEKLYYVLRFGGVLDEGAFLSVLGEHL